MKKLLIVSISVVACMFGGCRQAVFTPAETTVFHYADSTTCAMVRIDAEFPVAATPALQQVSDELAVEFANQARLITAGEPVEDDVQAAPSEVSSARPEELIQAIGEGLFAEFVQMAGADAEARKQYIQENPDLDDDVKADLMESQPVWEGLLSLRRISENADYMVYLSENYIYMGGAHGGVSGAGHLTFDTGTGLLFSNFLTEDAEDGLQVALRKGLKAYAAETDSALDSMKIEELFFVDHGTVPLPSFTPYPTAEGLVFVYQQYEIAPYAMGMPSFTVPYDVLMPYLTPEAVKLLHIKQSH